MSGDLAVRPEGDVAVPAAPNLAQWLEEAKAADQLARGLLASNWVPAEYKKGPEGAALANATGAILFGFRLGFDPITSLQNVHMINGRPKVSARMMLAVVTAAGHSIWTVERTATRCEVRGRNKHWPDSHVDAVMAITIEEAERSGWTSNNLYRTRPEDMLWRRCLDRVCEMVAPADLAGLISMEDDAELPEPEPVQVVARVNPAALGASQSVQQVTTLNLPGGKAGPHPTDASGVTLAEQVSRETFERVESEVEAKVAAAMGGTEPERTVDAPVSPAVRMIGKTGLGKLAQRFADLGIVAPDEGLALLSELTDRPVLNSRDLTAREAELVLDNLTAEVLDQHRARVMVDLDAEAAALQAEAEQVADA